MKKLFIAVFFVVLLTATLSHAASQAPVHYSKGMVAYSDKDYKKALGFFKKAYKEDSKNPDHLYLLALTYLQLNDSDKASLYFKEFLDNYPNYSKAYTERARRWIAEIEAEKKEEPGEKKLKKWNISAAGSFFYDSNVTLDPDDENLTNFGTNQEDVMSSAALDANYLLHRTAKTDLSVLYSGYQSFYGNYHFDLDRFNYGRHKGGAIFQYRINDRMQMRTPVDFTYVTLGKAKYSDTGSGLVAFDFAWKKNWLTTGYGAARWDEFWGTPTSSAQKRDAARSSGGFEQYYFFPDNRARFIKAGYEFTYNDALGNDWDYTQQRLTFMSNNPLFWKLNLAVVSDIVPLRKFRHTDSVFSVKRGDFMFSGSGVLSKEVIPHLTLSTIYTYSMVDSNIARYTYHRHLAGLTISTAF